MLRQLLEQNQKNINYFFEHIDVSAAESIYQLMVKCQGNLCFSGIGKSGLVAKKVAITMVSTGTKAIYISATNALHGDLGMISNRDIVTLFSKSGESEELLNLAPYIRNKGAKLIAIVSQQNSRLEKAAHYTLQLPLQKELCPFDLAPTTSAAIQLIFGDVLTVALMQEKKFTLDEYALNHPAGRIGKRISLRVADLMLTKDQIPLCFGQTPLLQVLQELSKKACGCVLIVDKHKKLRGIFTDGDLRRALQRLGSFALEKPVEEMMSTSPRYVSDTLLAWEAMKAMEADQQKAITVMPVVDKEGYVVGIIRMHDIIQSGL